MSEKRSEVKGQKSDKEKIAMLAKKVVWALKYMNPKGSGSMMMPTEDGSSFTIVSWVSDFCDALEECGYTIDRDALDRIRNPRKKKAARHSTPDTCGLPGEASAKTGGAE